MSFAELSRRKGDSPWTEELGGLEGCLVRGKADKKIRKGRGGVYDICDVPR